jgi:hypothetical protein
MPGTGGGGFVLLRNAGAAGNVGESARVETDIIHSEDEP